MNIKKIYLVPHFHFDFEWWKEEPYHEQDTLVIIDRGLEMLDTYPEFTYVIDSVLPLKNYIENRSEGLKRIKKHVDSGRIEIVGGDIVAPDEVIPTGEALIRQFEEGQQWLKDKFGREAKVAWEIDEFAHPARLPQVLSNLGFEQLVFARGIKPFDAMHPNFFHWNDPSGLSSIKSYWWSAFYECCQPDINMTDKDRKKKIKHYFKEIESRIVFEGERATVPYLMFPMGGDFAIPDKVWIDFVNEWNSKKDIKLEFTTPSQFFDKVNDFDIPQVKGLIPHVFDGYFTSREKGKQLGRQLANKLVCLEKLEAISQYETTTNSNADLKKAWWEVLKGDFHDTVAGTVTDRVFRKNMQRYDQANEIIQKQQKEILQSFENRTENKGWHVYNSNNWDRTEVLSINGDDKLVKAKAMAIESIEFVQNANINVETSKNVIENPYVKIEVNAKNGTLKFFDKINNTYPFTDGFGKIEVHDDVGNLWTSNSNNINYRLRFTGFKIISLSSLKGQIILNDENGFMHVERIIEVQAHTKQVNFKTKIRFKGKDKRVTAKFPMNFDGEWHTETTFYTESSANGVQPVQNFVIYGNSNYNIALINKGIPGQNLIKQEGQLILLRSVSMFSSLLILWIIRNLFTIFKLFLKSGYYLRKKLNIIEFPIYPIHNLVLRDFATEGDIEGHGAMNPSSHKKARRRFYKKSTAWEHGEHIFEYAVLPACTIDEAVKAGLAFNQPLLLSYIEGKGQSKHMNLFKDINSQVIISAFYPFKEGYKLRAYEHCGKQAKLEIEFTKTLEELCEIKGHKHSVALSTVNNKLVYNFDAYEMKEFYIKI